MQWLRKRRRNCKETKSCEGKNCNRKSSRISKSTTSMWKSLRVDGHMTNISLRWWDGRRKDSKRTSKSCRSRRVKNSRESLSSLCWILKARKWSHPIKDFPLSREDSSRPRNSQSRRSKSQGHTALKKPRQPNDFNAKPTNIDTIALLMKIINQWREFVNSAACELNLSLVIISLLNLSPVSCSLKLDLAEM